VSADSISSRKFMSDLVFNLRIWLYHFQIGKNKPYFRVHRNDMHRESKLIALYQIGNWYS
jgi:hypothetical protein